MKRKHLRQIGDALPDGLRIVPSRGHYKIVRADGSFVATVAGSPKNADHCVARALRDAEAYA